MTEPTTIVFCDDNEDIEESDIEDEIESNDDETSDKEDDDDEEDVDEEEEAVEEEVEDEVKVEELKSEEENEEEDDAEEEGGEEDNNVDEEEEDAGGEMDPTEFYEDSSSVKKKTKVKIIQKLKGSDLLKRKRGKNNKVSKQLKRKKRVEYDDISLNYIDGEIRKIGKELIGKEVERNIFNFLIKEFEKLYNRKVKQSDLSTSLFKTRYSTLLYDIYNLSSIYDARPEDREKKLVELLNNNKIAFNSPIFSQEQFKDTIETKNIETPPIVKEGTFICGKCVGKKHKDGGKKTIYYQLQTRGGDEPMTSFISCTVCGNKWKE